MFTIIGEIPIQWTLVLKAHHRIKFFNSIAFSSVEKIAASLLQGIPRRNLSLISPQRGRIKTLSIVYSVNEAGRKRIKNQTSVKSVIMIWSLKVSARRLLKHLLIHLVENKSKPSLIPDKLQKILKGWLSNLRRLFFSLAEDTNRWDINGTELSKIFFLFKLLNKMLL